MASGKLHPSVEQFKTFVKTNPKLLEDVRNGKSTLQDLYEEWYLLGEDDPRWDPFRSKEATEKPESSEKTEWYHQILGVVKNMDPNQMQHYIGNISQAIGAIQSVLGQFQNGTAGNPSPPSNEKPNNPFIFRKD